MKAPVSGIYTYPRMPRSPVHKRLVFSGTISRPRLGPWSKAQNIPIGLPSLTLIRFYLLLWSETVRTGGTPARFQS